MPLREKTYIRDGFVSAGDAEVTGSLGVSGTITGNLTGNVTGNASTATTATSATSATTATSASYATTSSYVKTADRKSTRLNSSHT